MNKFYDAIRSHWRYRDLVRNMVHKDLKVRFQGTALGFVWSLGVPLVMIGMYDFVFGHLFRSAIPNFALYLVIGLLHYNLLNQILMQGMGSLLEASGLLQRIYFPRIFVPTANVISSFVLWTASVAILVVALPVLGGHYSWHVIPYLGMLLLYLVMLWGVALGLAVLVVEFRDLRHLVEVGLIVLFWLTPIVYDPSTFSPMQQLVINLNPISHFIICFQDLLFRNRLPDAQNLAVAVAWTILCVGFGLGLFRRKAKWLVELL